MRRQSTKQSLPSTCSSGKNSSIYLTSRNPWYDIERKRTTAAWVRGDGMLKFLQTIASAAFWKIYHSRVCTWYLSGGWRFTWRRNISAWVAAFIAFAYCSGDAAKQEGRLFVFSCHCLLIDMPGGAIGSISAVESSYKLYVRRFGQSPSSTPPLPSMLWTMTFSILQSIDHQDHKLVRTNIFCFIFGHDHFLSLVA